MCQTMAGGQPTAPQTMGSQNQVFIINPWFDPSYLTTPPGMIKAAVIMFNLIGYICVQASSFWSNVRGVYFIITAHLGLWFSTAILLCYLWHVVEKYHAIKWLKIEMVGYLVLMFLYLVAATVAVAFGSAAFSAAGFFGYLAMVLYGLDGFLKYRALKSGEPAQGRRVIQQQQHITTPPALP